MRQTEIQAQNQGQGNDDEHNDGDCPPLELARSSCVVNAFCKLDIRLHRVLDNVFSLLFGSLHSGFLEDDGFGEVLEELVELFERALDLQDVIVAGADGTENGGCGTGAIRFELLVVRVSETHHSFGSR